MNSNMENPSFLVLLFLVLLIWALPSQEAQTSHPKPFHNTTFVLVHGLGFGAWCWFQVITNLQSEGYGVVAFDLAGAGVDPSDPNQITTLEQMGKPVMDYISNFSGPGKLTLVGHSLGGVFICMMMNKHPEKVSSAVFVAAIMPLNGDNFSSTMPPNFTGTPMDDGVLIFKDPSSPIPTSAHLKKDKVQAILLNESPQKYVELTLTLTKAMPFRPLLDKIHLSPQKHRSIKRFYIRTLHDFGVPLVWQNFNIHRNPVDHVTNIKSDHAPFFSRPKGLSNLLIKFIV